MDKERRAPQLGSTNWMGKKANLVAFTRAGETSAPTIFESDRHVDIKLYQEQWSRFSSNGSQFR